MAWIAGFERSVLLHSLPKQGHHLQKKMVKYWMKTDGIMYQLYLMFVKLFAVSK